MAFNVTYNIIAQDKFSKVGRKVDVANKKMASRFAKTSRKMGRDSDRLNKKFKNMSAAAGGFASSLKGLASVAIAGMAIKKVVEVGATFQDSMADLEAITGASGKQLKFLQTEALRLSKVSIKSASEIATAFKLVASAKPELLEDTKALAKVTEQVLLLSNASGLELEASANVAAQSLNIFGKNANFAAKYVNILAAGSKFGASEIRDTGEAILLAGPAARAAGLSFNQLNAAIQTVALGGIKGSQAGTALNAMLGRLQRAGIDFNKLGLEGSFMKIKTALENMDTPQKKAQLAAKIFGEEHAKVGFSILNNINMLTHFEKKLKGTTVAQDQANIRLNTFNKKSSRLGSVIGAKAIESFNKIEPAASKTVDAAAIVFENIDFLNTIPRIVIGGIIDLFNGVSAENNSTVKNSTIDSSLNSKSSSTVDVNLNAPQGVIKSIKSKSSGSTKLNVGNNMVPNY